MWDAVGRTWQISLWSAAASSVTLIVVDREHPDVAVALVGMVRGDDDRWSATISAATIGDADLYGFRVDGPAGPAARFDRAKLLLDPEATEVWFPPGHDRDLARVMGADTLGHSPFGVLPMTRPPALVPSPMPSPRPRHSTNDLVIYEVHVRGASMRSPHVDPDVRGTFAGLAGHVDHIASLGVTAVELLPVHQFDPAEGNYWGYMPLAWSALHNGYAADPHRADDEFRAMVETFHSHGIEVILDVVYNHTTEEDELGPTYHLRGIDDAAYYVLHDDGSYRDDAGCGNVVRAAHPAAGALVLDSLSRFIELGVDGFRFDLGSLLGRDIDGRQQEHSALIDRITALAAAHDVRLIAEPWDLSAYQIGDAFPGRTWAQWNGKFRDDCRAFLRAEDGAVAAFARRIIGSPDLYADAPGRSINFITAHDGFTLHDLVSYEHKHNDANGWNGTDGTDDNKSWNCGWEGDDFSTAPPDVDPAAVKQLRMQQMKNAFVLLTMSGGVPMIVAGDEFAQTQHGNNNPYNQDNETTWLDWSREADYADLTEFVRSAIRLRRDHGDGAIDLHGVDASPDLAWTSHSIAWQRGDLYVIANAWWEPLGFTIHPDGDLADGREWRVALSSSAATGPLLDGVITVAPRSTVVLART
ncbi:MAG: glgX [Ilumatobacteraceae bacterium]|nr:glgX [Ilumatobacteraceae bacterium]MCU1391570.1 glgX [Ilumatobacteraceae bacterium]